MQKLRNSKKKYLPLLVSLLCLALVGSFLLIPPPTPGLAAGDDPLADFRAEQERAEAEMERLEEEIAQSKEQIEDIESEIYSLDLQMEKLRKEEQAATAQIANLEALLAEIEQELAAAEAQLAERLDMLENRVVNVYTNGDVSFMDVLMDSTDFSEFLMRADMLDLLVQQDVELLDEVKALKAGIEENQALQEQRLADEVVLRQEKANAIAELDNMQAQKANLLAETEDNKAELEKQYEDWQNESDRIAAEIKRIQAQNSGNDRVFSGVFAWPLPSNYTTVTSEYGMRFHPILKVNKMHTGVDFSAPNGTEIYAADDGEVIIAGWSTAYGNYVVIDHGSGVTTLYGHMSKLGTTANTTVSRGDVIGYVGSTGYSTGNHLHFEVQLNGECTSPWDYL